MRVVIDPGHGGRDPGAVGPTGLREKDVVLTVARLLRERLLAAKLGVTMTRDTDILIPLVDRAVLANTWQADAFISIHCNAHSTSIAHGTETFHFTLSHPQNKRLADVLQKNLVELLRRRDRGVKRGNFQVLRQSTPPSALVELAFISNPDEEKLLATAEFQSLAARAIAEGIVEFLPRRLPNPVDRPPAREAPAIAPFTRHTLERMANCDIITAASSELEVALIRGQLNQDGINGGFFGGAFQPLGIVVIDWQAIAERVAHRPPRPVFAIHADGRAYILPSVSSVASLGTDIRFALGAGPTLLPAVADDEGFQPDIMTGARPRSAVGLVNAHTVKLVATAPMTLQQLAQLMRDLGCTRAINLDGGTSSAMRYGNAIIRGGERAISTAIVLRR